MQLHIRARAALQSGPRAPLSAVIVGGAEDDVLNGTDAADTITGAAGDDELYGRGGADRLEGGGGDDILAGGSGGDHLLGGDDFDSMTGGSGNDVLDGGGGADRLDGGSGFDTASYASSPVGVFVDLLFNQYDGDAVGDQFVSIEALSGSDFNDTLRGSNAMLLLIGGVGNDVLISNGPAPTLVGGLGIDHLTNFDAAHFVYEALSDSPARGSDKIFLSRNEGVIDVSAIDADETQAGDQAFQLVGAFSGAAGEIDLKYRGKQDITVVRFDTDGDGDADMKINLSDDQRDFDNFIL